MTGPRIDTPLSPHGTHTSEGFIPHLRVTAGTLVFQAPVRIVRRKGREPQRDGLSLPQPERDADGRLVYALPGGGCVSAQ